MLTSQRRALIAARLARDGQIVAGALAAELGLSEDTIRRDLREMAQDGLLQRVHGGALPLAAPLPDFATRQTIDADVKQRLGRAALSLISPGQLIYLDGGTSNAEIARALPRDAAVTIATHSPTIAGELEGHAAEVILIGGRLYKHSMVATGAAALAMIATMRPDLFFIGATAIHPVHGLSTGDFEEAAVKRAIAAQARETVLLSVAAKFNAVSPHAIIPASHVSTMVVPHDLLEETLAPYRTLGIRIASA